MPFCTQCGSSIGESDQFCAACGSRQGAGDSAGSGTAAAHTDLLGKVDARTAAVLCYLPIVGWIPSIFVLASAKFQHDKETRFHAFQGLYIFVGWLLADWVLRPVMRTIGWPLGLYPIVTMVKGAFFLAWIWMLVKVSQNQMFKLPLVGELAERSVAEQR